MMTNDTAATQVALASLVKLITLIGAEMLVGKYREDIDVFESCVRAKLFAHVPGISSDSTAAGVAMAHSLVEPVLAQLRERVRQMHAAQEAAAAAEIAAAPPQREAVPNRLN